MASVKLTKGFESLVDDSDFDQVSQWKWCYSGYENGYAVRKPRIDGRSKTIYLHRFIVNAPIGMEVDHINGDRLDNRRSNLRVCTRQQNNKNVRKHCDNTSGFKGVFWEKRRKKWYSKIRESGVQKFLGYFPTPELAYEEYKKAAVRCYGEFARFE